MQRWQLKMIDKTEAISAAERYLAENPLPHEDYEWTTSEPIEVPEGWYFDFTIHCRLDLPEDEWEQFGGAPGFLVSKESGDITVLNWQTYCEQKEKLANKSLLTYFK